MGKASRILFASYVCISIQTDIMAAEAEAKTAMPTVESQSEKPSVAATAKSVRETVRDDRTKPSAQVLREAIDAALNRAFGMPTHNLETAVTKGVVILRGTVDNLLAKERATEIVSEVGGVMAVDNQLVVKPIERSDREITKDINAAFNLEPSHDGSAFEVSVKDAKVTLSGTAPSWQALSQAVNIVQGIKGVRTIDNLIKIEYPATVADDQVKSRIEQRLKADKWVNHEDIDVTVVEGDVYLRGDVASLHERNRAVRAAWVDGVRSINTDDIDVEGWQSPISMTKRDASLLTEAEIADAIIYAYAYNPHLTDQNLPTVKVTDRVATLTGKVTSLRAKREAEAVAANTFGVEQVKNELSVTGNAAADDAEIAELVEAAINRDAYVERYQLNVESRNGKVYLTGTVENAFDKNRAEDLATHINGVQDVSNLLTVKGETPADEALSH